MNPNPNPKFTDLSELLGSMDTVEKSMNNRKIWDQAVQMQLASQSTGQTINQPYSMGSALFSQMNQPKTADRNLFFQNYIDPKAAARDHTTIMANANSVYKAQGNSVVFAGNCHVFPPLLVRYEDHKMNRDQYIPVEILPSGELKLTNEVPDIILNFHADSKAITVTTCNIKPEKLVDFKIVISTLYNMTETDPNQTVDVRLFTLLYDKTRYMYLRTMQMQK